VIDRDHRSEFEVAELAASGVRVLSRRHLEAFLLDDEVLGALCIAVQQPQKTDEVLEIRMTALAESVARGNDGDDLKSAAGTIFTRVRTTLALQQPGNSTEAFLADTLAPLIKPGLGYSRNLSATFFGRVQGDATPAEDSYPSS
jgi:hypothetical protein